MPTPQENPAELVRAMLDRAPCIDPFSVAQHNANTLILSVHAQTGSPDVYYVTVSDRPPKESRELIELEEMDTLLKASMLAVSDAKTLREIVGERRQLQKQMSQLRTSLSSGDPSGSKGKLDELKGREW